MCHEKTSAKFTTLRDDDSRHARAILEKIGTYER